MNRRRRAFVACGLLYAVPCCAAATLRVEPGQSLAQALRKASDGDTIEIVAGAHRGQVGVIEQRRLTLRGVGGRPVLHAAGRSAEGKAILVVRDGDVRIENIEFRGARVAARNGAGIRFERGRLAVLDCAFYDNENGILTGNHGDAELLVEDSEFGSAPPSPVPPHLLYVGHIARFTLRGSRVSEGRTGHLVKSRARDNAIFYNWLVDGPRGQASYELEFPNGGRAFVVGNVVGQGAGARNPTLVSYGAEGTDERALRLVMIDNTLVNDSPEPAIFVRVHELGRPVARLYLNTLMAGLGFGELGLADLSRGNYTLPLAALRDAPHEDYALPEDAWLRGRGVDPGAWVEASLVPDAEIALPIGTRPLVAPLRWSPGAWQD